jgi:hypothetical protein
MRRVMRIANALRPHEASSLCSGGVIDTSMQTAAHIITRTRHGINSERMLQHDAVSHLHARTAAPPQHVAFHDD